MKHSTLTNKDIQEILYLSKQGNGRKRLITNLFRITEEELQEILDKYTHNRLV